MGPHAYQLRDIHGLDSISWLPPAPGWWLLALGLILAAWLAWRFLPRYRVPALAGIGWRWDASRKLRELRRRVGGQDPKHTAAELSELLRRIAMARFGRDLCAGLTGEQWLAWLRDNDPQDFDWPRNARLLLDMPYAPPGHGEAQERRFMALIDAAQNWVAREDKKADEKQAQKKETADV